MEAHNYLRLQDTLEPIVKLLGAYSLPALVRLHLPPLLLSDQQG